jgi:ubiquinone/menaquinone biosynthesis C-methylase UbiE
MSPSRQPGYIFLAQLGKRRLRPGGKIATDWLLKKGNLKRETHVLEVACNMGTTTIELAAKYGCHITACDVDQDVLVTAAQNIEKAGLKELVSIRHEDALRLSFADESFDIVLNEAMLTMLSQKGKEKAAAEFFRVLKPGGTLLTHNVVLRDTDEELRKQIIADLSKVVKAQVSPLTQDSWNLLFTQAGFKDISLFSGDVTLMTPQGMFYDEGLRNTVRIIKNALTTEKRARFFEMARVFKKYKKQIGFIAVCGKKSG